RRPTRLFRSVLDVLVLRVVCPGRGDASAGYSDCGQRHENHDECWSIACHVELLLFYAKSGDSFFITDANISSAQPYRIRSMPTTRPMNHIPEAGHCMASKTPRTIVTTAEATLHPQLGKRSIAAIVALNKPPAMK